MQRQISYSWTERYQMKIKRMSMGNDISRTCIFFLTSLFTTLACAQTELSDVPMAVKNGVLPNVLVVYDNSQSMDAYMGGTLVSGNDPQTRGNIGRQVMRNAITTYRDKFRWGLMSYELSGAAGLYNTYAYYFGSDTGMVFTDDCVNGVSASNGNRKCLANLEPFTGGSYVTYDKSGDDADILDVFYTGSVFDQLWTRSSGTGTCYRGYRSHNSVNAWEASDFTSTVGNLCFTPTDAGFLSSNPPYTRQYYIPRGKGYNANITGAGTLLEPAAADSLTHYNNLMNQLASETLDTATGELKNAAVFTPLRGTLTSAKSYFSGDSSPITASCQKNFVMLVTDGLPTGTNTGTLYSAAERTNTQDPSTQAWAFGTAAQHAIDATTALRTTVKGAVMYDIPTYVVALGDTINNAGALAVMDKMASEGGTSTAKPATNATAFTSAIETISQDILSKDGAAAAVTVSNPNIVVGGVNASYNSSYNSGAWTGELQAYPVSTTTGEVDTDAPIWDSGAQAQLDALTAGDYSPTDRTIVTYSGSGTGGLRFQPSSESSIEAAATKLTTAQETVFNSATTPPGPSDAANVMKFLRGDRSNEGTSYRSRGHVLGDIINAEPVLVQAPSRNYTDTCYAIPVTDVCTLAETYKAAQANRTSVLFQAANDGMVHAFNASTGAENWAYVPNLIWPNLRNLSKRIGFTHQYYVDATPNTGDVDLRQTDDGGGDYGGNLYNSPQWRTILVGGLGKGGRGYYALDVTNPTVSGDTPEADATAKVMWEFPNSATSNPGKVGYTFGRPIIVKTRAEGWVVIVTSGYNNITGTGADGHGRLFVLNPRTGEIIKEIDTGVGTLLAPAGLAKVSHYVENARLDNTVEYVYGGDLLGNVWRFDFTGNTKSDWGVRKLAALVDSAGVAQPVTTKPQLAKISVNGIDYRYVYVGTGKYLGDSDVATTQTQTMYGLIDNLTNSPEITITSERTQLQQQTMTTLVGDSTKRVVSNNAIALTGGAQVKKRGWYLDFSLSAGERAVTDPQLAVGALMFTTNIPSSVQCVPGGSSWFYAIDIKTGGWLTGSTEAYSGQFLGNALASRPTLVKLPSGAIKAIIRLSGNPDWTPPPADGGVDDDDDNPGDDDGANVPVEVNPGPKDKTLDPNLPPTATSGRRVSWREVITN